MVSWVVFYGRIAAGDFCRRSQGTQTPSFLSTIRLLFSGARCCDTLDVEGKLFLRRYLWLADPTILILVEPRRKVHGSYYLSPPVEDSRCSWLWLPLDVSVLP